MYVTILLSLTEFLFTLMGVHITASLRESKDIWNTPNKHHLGGDGYGELTLTQHIIQIS